MAAAKTNKGRAPIGSMQWIIEEREQAAKFRAQELEDLDWTVRNEIEWLNEHMAEIFATNGVNMIKAFKSPVKLKAKTPRTVRKIAPPPLLNDAPIAPPKFHEDVVMKDADIVTETVAPTDPDITVDRPSLSKSLFEKNSIFDEEPQAVQSSNTSSQNSTPAKPPVRKSSLTFACLPAREPLATKKSMGTTSKVNVEGSVAATVEKKPTKMTIAQIKSSTQLLHEKINLLGQSMRTKQPRKSIVTTTPAAPSIAPKTPHIDEELQVQKSKIQQIIQSARGRLADKTENVVQSRESPEILAEPRRKSLRTEHKAQASTTGRVISNTKNPPVKESRRPVKPTKEPAPKTKPQPVSIKVGFPSQRIPQLVVEKKRVETNKPVRPNVARTMAKPSTKRALEPENMDPKRRRTREPEPQAGLRPAMKPPVRPSNMHKNLSKATQPKDLAKYANGKIPFAEVPNPPSKFRKATLLSKAPIEEPRPSSPASMHGTDISLEEPETSEDEIPGVPKKPKKKRPTWTNSPELRAQLLAQEFVDAEDIFGPLKWPVLEELFPEYPERHAWYRQRGPSADWSKDGLTQAEIDFDNMARKAIRDNGGWAPGLY